MLLSFFLQTLSSPMMPVIWLPPFSRPWFYSGRMAERSVVGGRRNGDPPTRRAL